MIADGALILTSYRGICFGQRIILTHWYRANGAGPGASFTADLNLILDQLIPAAPGSFVPQYLACLPADYTLQEIRAQAITPTRSVMVSRTLVGAVGTHAGQATVANDAAVITYRTDFGGRAQTSSRHIGPVPDAASAAGLITNAYAALLNSLALDMDDGQIPVGWVGGLISVVPHVATAQWNDITSFVIQDTSRVMRRRTVRVGE